MVFTIALMECGYRLVYWCWMEVYPHSDVQLAASRVHFWLTGTAMVGMVWFYLMWQVIDDDRKPRKDADRAPRKKNGEM